DAVENAMEGLVGQRSGVEGRDLVEHGLLALRVEDGKAVALLEGRDAFGAARALVEQPDQLRVQRVDADPPVVEVFGLRAAHRAASFAGAISGLARASSSAFSAGQ